MFLYNLPYIGISHLNRPYPLTHYWDYMGKYGGPGVHMNTLIDETIALP